MRVRRALLFFNRADPLPSGVSAPDDGTIDRFDLRTHRHTVYARRLIMPNGLVFLPNGDALTSRDIGGPPGRYLVPPRHAGHPRPWAETASSNHMARRRAHV